MEAAFRDEYILADYVQRRFGNHPQVRSIHFNREDPDKDKCTRQRMDVRILTHTRGCVVVELDENQHVSYNCSAADMNAKWRDINYVKMPIEAFEKEQQQPPESPQDVKPTKFKTAQRRMVNEMHRVFTLAMSGTIEKMVVFRINPDRFRNPNDTSQFIERNQILDADGNLETINQFAARKWRFDALGDDLQRYLDADPDMERDAFIPVFKYFFNGAIKLETFAPATPDELHSWKRQLFENENIEPTIDWKPNPNPTVFIGY
jgi:hypothetical protein